MSQARRKSETHTSALIFAALGDEMRLRIVSRLVGQTAMSISQLASGAPVTRQAITKHLHVLEDAGLIQGSKCGREQRWTLQPQQISHAQRYLDSIARQWDDALARLKLSIERDAGKLDADE